MASVKMPAQLDCNRLVKEANENREYKRHMKKLENIRKAANKANEINEEPLRLPDINRKNLIKIQHEIDYFEKENNSNALNTNRLNNKSNNSSYTYSYNIQNISNNNSKKHILNSYWNPAYEQLKNRAPLKSKQLMAIENENEKMKKRLNNVKGSINLKKMDKDFEQHQAMLKMTSKSFYTPRGIGHRKTQNLNALPSIKPFNRNKKKNAVSMLNEAVNQQERGDIVLIKTMLNLNYYERMETKRKYEETYNGDLKKGLIKVMDKEYEPLLTAILTDKDLYDADRIYEALYDPNEAAIVITDSLITRDTFEKNSLLDTFKKKIQYDLKDEITNKIPEGELRNILFDLLENENLDKKLDIDLDKIKSDVEELKTLDEIPLNCEILINAIKTNTKEELKALFDEHQKEESIDICSKMETNKPIGKVFKVIQSFLTNPALYFAEKLQKNLKTNETEFIRLLAIYPKEELENVEKEYQKKYKSRLYDDINSSLNQDISRLVLQILNPTVS